MKEFTYYTPTKVAFGRGAWKKVGELVKEQGGTRVLIHYGGGSAVRSGLIGRIEEILTASGISYVELGGVKPNPRLSLALEGIELAKAEHVDFILAVGGGSVIDSAKEIGYGLANGGNPWDFHLGIRKATACTPIGAVLTIAAAGSEMSNSNVITNEDGMIKRGHSCDYGRCRFAVMDPELTMTLPWYQTASGCVDIMMHTMERYFTQDTDTMLTDGMSEALLRTVMYHGRRLLKDPMDYESRAQIMWAGSLSHNGLMSCGSAEDWACHQLEHELSGMFDVAHGAGLSAVWSSWARYVMDARPERFAQLAVNVLGVPYDCSHPEETALAGIDGMERFFTEMKMPVRIPELGIDPTPDQIREMVSKCSRGNTRTIGGIKKLDEQDMTAIYEMAMQGR